MTIADHDLTPAQAVRLRICVAAGREGRIAADQHIVMRALERRKLVEAQPCAANSARFVATLVGREWVRAADEREGLRPAEAMPSPWQGQAVEGSRWTAEQLAALRADGVEDPERCAVATVTRRAASGEHDWTQPVPTLRIDLPCLAATHGGTRGKVVLPGGRVTWSNIVACKAADRGR